MCREGYEEGSRSKSVEGIIRKQIGFDKFGELEVMPSFKGEMREYPANYEIIRAAIEEQEGEVEWSQNTGPAGDLQKNEDQTQPSCRPYRGRHRGQVKGEFSPPSTYKSKLEIKQFDVLNRHEGRKADWRRERQTVIEASRQTAAGQASLPTAAPSE